MLASLPSFAPRDAFTLWSPVAAPVQEEAPSPPQSSAPGAPQQQRRSHSASAQNTLHARLRAEEERFYAGEMNVQRFGSTWLRPPGVSKTYQATMDEEVERLEAQMLATREAERREMEAAEEEAARTAMQRADGDAEPGADDEADDMQRDLDDDVPEAEDQADLDMDADEDDAFVEQDEDDLSGGRDLDDDVPEAGSYQHTDTEVEDQSSDEGGSSPRFPEQEAEEQVTPASGGRQASWAESGPHVIQNFQVPLPIPIAPAAISFGTPSEPAESSMVMSSPIAARPAARGARTSTPSAAERRSRRSARRLGEN